MKILYIILAVILSREDAILRLSGASCLEELEEYEIERFSNYAEHPLSLNKSSKSRLLSSGLLSSYQAASLLDYRQRHGDVLSFSELQRIGGFPEEAVAALKHFVSLESGREIGKRNGDSLKVSHSIEARASVRKDSQDNAIVSFGGKIHVAVDEYGELSWASRKSYSDDGFPFGNLCAAVYMKKLPITIIAGNFNARFGEGLCIWSGFAMSGYQTVKSMSRSGSGFSPSHSYSRNLCGIAVEADIGKWTVSAAWDHKGEGIIAASRLGRISQTGICAKASKNGYGIFANWKFSLKNSSLYGEAGYDGLPKALAGWKWIPAYLWKTGAVVKYTGSGAEAAAGLEAPFMETTVQARLDLAKKEERYRMNLRLFQEHKTGSLSIKPEFRICETYLPGDGPQLKNDLRADLAIRFGPWSASGRANLVIYNTLAWLWYAEAGYKGTFQLWLRGGVFKIDNWKDRIYVYERDAPGNMTIPAYYGRGCNFSFCGGWKGLFLRVSAILYPWMKDKAYRTEVKLQYRVKL